MKVRVEAIEFSRTIALLSNDGRNEHFTNEQLSWCKNISELDASLLEELRAENAKSKEAGERTHPMVYRDGWAYHMGMENWVARYPDYRKDYKTVYDALLQAFAGLETYHSSAFGIMRYLDLFCEKLQPICKIDIFAETVSVRHEIVEQDGKVFICVFLYEQDYIGSRVFDICKINEEA